MRFAFGFGRVKPQLPLKDIGNDLLGHESPTDACSPTPARKRLLCLLPTAVLEVKFWEMWRNMERLSACYSEFYQPEYEEFLSTSVFPGRQAKEGDIFTIFSVFGILNLRIWVAGRSSAVGLLLTLV